MKYFAYFCVVNGVRYYLLQDDIPDDNQECFSLENITTNEFYGSLVLEKKITTDVLIEESMINFFEEHYKKDYENAINKALECKDIKLHKTEVFIVIQEGLLKDD